VFDAEEDFTALYNPQLVDVSRVTDEKDADLLRQLISRHVLRTHSLRGQEILENWDAMLPRFWKVLPHEAKLWKDLPKKRGEKVRHLPIVERVEGEHVEAHVGKPAHPVKT